MALSRLAPAFEPGQRDLSDGALQNPMGSRQTVIQTRALLQFHLVQTLSRHQGFRGPATLHPQRLELKRKPRRPANGKLEFVLIDSHGN